MKETKENWIQKECLSIDQDIRNGIGHSINLITYIPNVPIKHSNLSQI